MSTEKKAVCLYLPTNIDKQIDTLANDMNIPRSNVVSIAVAHMSDNKDALVAAVEDIFAMLSKQEKEVPEDKKESPEDRKELYNILDHIKDAMEIQLHLVAFSERTQQAEHEIKLYNVLIERAKYGMALIKKK